MSETFAITKIINYKIMILLIWWNWNLSGNTYKFRVSNVGIAPTINFRIEGHSLKLIEVEGAHTMQELYDSLDVHVGQSVTVLVTLNGSPKDYYVVVSSRFSKKNLAATAALRYQGSNTKPSGPLPPAPTFQFHGSMKQARTIRYNQLHIFKACSIMAIIVALFSNSVLGWNAYRVFWFCIFFFCVWEKIEFDSKCGSA